MMIREDVQKLSLFGTLEEIFANFICKNQHFFVPNADLYTKKVFTKLSKCWKQTKLECRIGESHLYQ